MDAIVGILLGLAMGALATVLLVDPWLKLTGKVVTTSFDNLEVGATKEVPGPGGILFKLTRIR